MTYESENKWKCIECNGTGKVEGTPCSACAIEDAEIEDAEIAVMNAMNAKVEAAIKAAGHKRCYVSYSAYDSDDSDVPIDNLDNVAIEGKVVFASKRNEFYGGEKSKNYQSEVIENPTWLQVCVYANEMIKTTRDLHHVFLEGVDISDPYVFESRTRTEELEKLLDNGVLIYEFIMGS